MILRNVILLSIWIDLHGTAFYRSQVLPPISDWVMYTVFTSRSMNRKGK